MTKTDDGKEQLKNEHSRQVFSISALFFFQLHLL